MSGRNIDVFLAIRSPTADLNIRDTHRSALDSARNPGLRRKTVLSDNARLIRGAVWGRDIGSSIYIASPIYMKRQICQSSQIVSSGLNIAPTEFHDLRYLDFGNGVTGSCRSTAVLRADEAHDDEWVDLLLCEPIPTGGRDQIKQVSGIIAISLSSAHREIFNFYFFADLAQSNSLMLIMAFVFLVSTPPLVCLYSLLVSSAQKYDIGQMMKCVCAKSSASICHG